jgi:hypothetical protein
VLHTIFNCASRLCKKQRINSIVLCLVSGFFSFLLALQKFHKLTAFRKYLVAHEVDINKRYSVDTGIGYNLYFRNFSDADIAKLLSSPIANDFVACHNFPVKLRMSFILTAASFVVLSFV